jgi:hypothetical protein
MASPTYDPINTLKRVAPDLWIVDGPLIRFGPPLLRMPFPTRMTVIRLEAGLFIHSPTALTPSLAAQIAAIGTPRWIIGPNRIHYWWLPDWHKAYPKAEVYAAPRIAEQAGDHIDFPCRPLTAREGYPWDGAIATLPVPQDYMSEVVFFHRPSRTLLLTDFIENFEAARLSPFMRLLTRLGGVQHPHGGMPRDMRFVFRHGREALKAAIETMLAWQPERLILAHGKWFERDGEAELRRAFAWLLKP